VAQAKATLIKAHRDNIRRYRRLLETRLTDLERHYIEGRLLEEKSALLSVSDVNQTHTAATQLKEP